MTCTYYSKSRPLGMGCYPDSADNPVVEVVNFESPRDCPRIGTQAWGYVTYPSPLSERDASLYELAPGAIVPSEAEVSLALDTGLFYPAIIDGTLAVCLFGSDDCAGVPKSFMIYGSNSVSSFWREGRGAAAHRVRSLLASLAADDSHFKDVNIFAMNARLLADDIRKPKVTPIQVARMNEMSHCDALAALLG